MQGTFLKFRTKEEAIRFAERQRYAYEVMEPPETKFEKKVYAKNFQYSGKKLRFFHTK
jgi:NADH dehydrogenase (ubiquinone) Fe-S protein 4